MTPTSDWDGLRVALALARAGSLRGAAEALKMSHTTVARRIDTLEASLGVRLFCKGPQGYTVTEAGACMLATAEQMERAMLAAAGQLSGLDRRPSGVVRLTLPDLLGTHLLMPDLAAFTQRYPEVDLHIIHAYDTFDLFRDEADIALRMVRPDTQLAAGLVGRRVGQMAYAHYQASAHPMDVTTADWIGWATEEEAPDWITHSPAPDRPRRHHLNHPLLQLEAARAGMGMALLPCFLGDACSELERLPGTVPRVFFDLWLLTHPDLKHTTRMRALRDHLATALERHAPMLSGS